MQDISFQDVSQQCYSMINNNENDSEKKKVIQRLYSSFSFLYLYAFLNSENSEKYYNCIWNILKKHKFITYYYTNFHNLFKFLHKKDTNIINPSENNVDVVLCVENNCLIIEQIDQHFFEQNIMEKIKSFSINIKCGDTTVIEEIYQFRNYFNALIRNNKFIKSTIDPISCYMIRRFYCPSKFFIDPSFFIFDKNDTNKMIDQAIQKSLIDLFNTYSNEEISNKIKELQDYIKNIKKNIKKDDNKIHISNFQSKDFIELRQIYNNDNSNISLQFHLKSFYIFALKRYKYPIKIETDKETAFIQKLSHRCLVPFYGFHKNKNEEINGLVYEFMSHESLDKYFNHKKDKINNVFLFTIIIRIFKGIQFIHSNHFIHRDIKPQNILLNHDLFPFIADFETIRNLENSELTFSYDFVSYLYGSPEQIYGKKVSYPTDIYSLGCTIYFLYNKKIEKPFIQMNSSKIPSITNATTNIQNIYYHCFHFKPSNRITLDKIEKKIKDEIISNYYVDLYMKDIFKSSITNEIIQYFHEAIMFFDQDSNEFDKYFENTLNQDTISLFHYIEFSKTFSTKRFLYIGNLYKEGFGIEKNYRKAKKWYEFAAMKNNPDALCFLGIFYFNGFGVETNYLRSIKYFKLAATKKHSEAQHYLGLSYYNGYGVEQDYLQSFKYFKLAAEQNNSEAQNYLGQLYYYGDGIKKDYYQSFKYFQFAAEQNNSEAQYYLGVLYCNGYGVEQDYLQSFKYFKSSADSNQLKAQYAVGLYYFYGYGVKKDYYQSFKYFQLAAEQNNSEAQYYLGVLYCNGYGVEQDYLQSFKYFKSSAEENNSKAQLFLGILYYYGCGVQIDYSRSIEYFQLAAEQNNSNAQYYLGLSYYSGYGVKIDYSKSIEYFKLAAKQNNSNALYYLGLAYYNGTGTSINISKSIKNLKLAAELNNLDAIQMLGDLYMKGLGVERNYDMAKKYFDIGSKQNDFLSFLNLVILYQFGIGTKQEHIRAKEFFETEQNNPLALNILGLFYVYGIGVNPDYKKAESYFRLALKQKIPTALFGMLHLSILRGDAKNFELFLEQIMSNFDYIKIIGDAYSLYDFKNFKNELARSYKNIFNKQNKNAVVNSLSSSFISKFLKNLYNSFSRKQKDHEINQLFLEIIDIINIFSKNTNQIDFKIYLPNLSEYIKTLVEIGESEMIDLLGIQYYYGFSIDKNYDEARKKFELSAEKKDSFALINLAKYYSDGHNCAKELYKSRDLLIKSAKMNNTLAMNRLGDLYRKQQVFKDDKEAYKVYNDAAKQNDPNAFYNLSKLYFKGTGVEKNTKIALDYLNKAAEKNNSKAFIKLGNLYSKGEIVSQDYQKAEKYYELATLHNNPKSYFHLGDLYSNIEFIDFDLQKAIKNFVKCAELKNEMILTYNIYYDRLIPEYRFNKYIYRADNDLGLIYLLFFNNFDEAKKNLRKAADNEYQYGQNSYGLLLQFYMNSIGDAKHYFQKASQNHFALAYFNLGHLFEEEKQIKESINNYINASENEDHPLIFQAHRHYDKRLEISKTFIICLANLIITEYYLSNTDYENARHYFIKSFSKIIINNDSSSYKFQFNFNKYKPFSYLKSFIFNSPLFNFINQQEMIHELQLNDIQIPNNNDNNSNESTKSKCEKNIMDQKDDNKYFDSFHLEKNENYIISLNDSKVFEDPGELFDYAIINEEIRTLFIESIKDVIKIMKKILYMPPYKILFGRIGSNIINRKSEQNEKQTKKYLHDINSLFFEGFGINI